MEELDTFKVKSLKEMETEKEEIERQLVITESFKRYSQEAINKGNASNISCMAHDLHARAEELWKTEDERDCHRLSEIDIIFKPSAITTDRVKNLIGKLVFRG